MGSARLGYIYKKSVEPCSTLILITWGPIKTFTIKKNDSAHAEYVYTPIHYGTLSAITANSCTIDARRNTHPVDIRYFLVLDGKKIDRFQVTKTSVNKRLLLCPRRHFTYLSPRRAAQERHFLPPTARLLFISL